jgi:predicted AAA+ superfamily ATPase
MGQFIISGSQNFHLMESISQSLAGRVGIFRMYPFDFAEMKNANWLTENYASAMSRGFYPALFDRNIPSSKYFKDYIDTYLMRDVNQLKNIQDARSFKTFLRLCATRAGQLLNYNDLARDAGISHTTARSWISVLETSYIVFLLPPYFKNYSKRLIKSPKLYFYDTGLLCYLLNFKDEPPTITNSYYGSIFENMVISELIKQNEHKQLGREYFFWRDSKGHEIDLLYDVNNQLHIGEVKATKTISNKLFEGLDKFSAISTDEIKSKSLYYAGDINQVGDKYKILGWKSIE